MYRSIRAISSAAHVGRAVLNIHAAACWCQTRVWPRSGMRCLAAKSAIASPPRRCTHRAGERCMASSRSRPPGCGSGGRCARPAWVGQLHRRDRRAKGMRAAAKAAPSEGTPVLGEGRRHQRRQATQAQGQGSGGKLAAGQGHQGAAGVGRSSEFDGRIKYQNPEVVAWGRPGVPGVGREFRTARRAPGLLRAMASPAAGTAACWRKSGRAGMAYPPIR